MPSPAQHYALAAFAHEGGGLSMPSPAQHYALAARHLGGHVNTHVGVGTPACVCMHTWLARYRRAPTHTAGSIRWLHWQHTLARYPRCWQPLPTLARYPRSETWQHTLAVSSAWRPACWLPSLGATHAVGPPPTLAPHVWGKRAAPPSFTPNKKSLHSFSSNFPLPLPLGHRNPRMLFLPKDCEDVTCRTQIM